MSHTYTYTYTCGRLRAGREVRGVEREHTEITVSVTLTAPP